MRRAIAETERRRKIQKEYNEKHGIVPKTIKKGIRDLIDVGLPSDEASAKKQDAAKPAKMGRAEREKLIESMTREMKEAAKRLDFELAAYLRDRIKILRDEGAKKK
jgi:excinuclease ABC subunit B